MRNKTRITKFSLLGGVVAGSLLVALPALGLFTEFDLSWYTIDGGAHVGISSGELELSGTIGQPDAGTLSGGGFELTGGFWAVAVPTQCEGDANGDGFVDPLDTGFVLARFGCPVGTGDRNCDSADQNGDGIVNPLDSGFVLARFGPCS